MPWAEWKTPIAGKQGFLYDVLIDARGRRDHHYPRLLQSTRADHRQVAHICLDGGGKLFRFTLPACFGADKVKEIVARFYDAAMNTFAPGLDERPDATVQALADTYPEYVLVPKNPMTFLGPGMPRSFFSV